MSSPRRPDPLAGRLAGLALTYPEVGASAGTLPGGYDHLELDGLLGVGRPAYDAAVEVLMTWQMHERAGMTPVADADRVVVGAHVLQRPGIGPWRLAARCRVVAVVDEADRAGFAYGTLPGHPESGEERFVVELGADGEVRLHIRAFSRPTTWYARLGRPIVRLAQRAIAWRYVRALRQASTTT